MVRALTISQTGLRLIKAFEGFRPVARELLNGQHVIGYGHQLYSDSPGSLSRAEAEALLRQDIEPFEDMINSEVYAPLSQGQFDALCSFAFNIGPKAFRESTTLRALNKGRPLEAANSLDAWRKAEINGKTYIIDALMRRRTAEKALFLKTDSSVQAGRIDIPPLADERAVTLDDDLPIFPGLDAVEGEEAGLVMPAPIEKAGTTWSDHETMITAVDSAQGAGEGSLDLFEQNREDDIYSLSAADIASGPTDLSEISKADIDVETDLEARIDDLDWNVVSSPELDTRDDLPSASTPDISSDSDLEPDPVAEAKFLQHRSAIAEAATGVVGRLEALIENTSPKTNPPDPKTDEAAPSYNSEQAVPETETLDNVGSDKASLARGNQQSLLIIDELDEDDALRNGRGGDEPDSASKYIKGSGWLDNTTPSQSGLWIPILVGFILFGASLVMMLRGAQAILGDWGPILTFTGLLLGTFMVLVSIYVALSIEGRD